MKTPLPPDVAKTDLPLWSPAEFDGSRAIETVHDIWAHVLDIDEDPIPDAETLRDALSGLRAVCYSSSSATAESPRWRAAIALSRPVTAEEYSRIANVVIATLPFAVGSASRDPSRQWYFPRVGVDGYFECFSLEGEPLDVDEWLASAPEILAATPATSNTGGLRETQHYPGDVESGTEEHQRRCALYRDYLKNEAPARGPERRGQGDVTLFEVVQRGAYDLALPVDNVLELVRDHYDPRCDPPWGNELEERVHHKAHSAKTASSRPRMEPLPVDLLVSPAANAPATAFDTPAFVRGSSALGERWGGWDVILLPPVYLLEGLIPEGKVVTFFAEGGSVKTWSALALAISVATGNAWLGRYPVKKGRVLYLDYEDGPYEVGRRVRMLTGGVEVPDLGYLYGGPNIDHVDLWKTLARKVLEEGITLIVIDSLNAGMPGDADENTTAFANGMKIAGRFTETGCTVLFVHHANKAGGMRGTSAARDASDVVFKFEPVSETETVKRMRMICDKPGPQKRPVPVNVELSDSGLTTFIDEAATAGYNATTLPAMKDAILLALAGGPIVGTMLETKVTGRAEAIRDAVRVLADEGKIVSLGKFRGWQLDDDASRRARVIAAAPGCNDTKAALARLSHVPGEYVEAALRERVITLRTGKDGGGFIVLPSG